MENTPNHTKVNYAERLEKLRQALGGVSRNVLVDIIKVSLSTINRIELYSHEPTPYFFSQLRKYLPGAVDFMKGETDDLPDLLPNKPGPSVNKAHDGELLKKYLKENKISARELGRELGIAETGALYYIKTVNLRADVKSKIAKALKVDEEKIFGIRNIVRPTDHPEIDLFSVPVVSLEKRKVLTKSYLEGLLNRLNVEDVYSRDFFYIRRNTLSNDEIARAVVIEIAASDNMQPVLLPGALVLGLLVPETEYEILDRFVMISAVGRLMVRRIVSNQLRTADRLEIVSVDNNFSGSLTIKREDIDFVIELISIVHQPLK